MSTRYANSHSTVAKGAWMVGGSGGDRTLHISRIVHLDLTLTSRERESTAIHHTTLTFDRESFQRFEPCEFGELNAI